MSYREYAKFLIDQIPEGKLPYVVSFLMGAAIPDSSDDAYCEQLLKEYQNDPAPTRQMLSRWNDCRRKWGFLQTSDTQMIESDVMTHIIQHPVTRF